MSEKIFCGSGKKHEFANGGSITNITIDLDKILEHAGEFGFTTQNGKRMIKLKVATKKEVDEYGKTHSVEIDTWKPDNANQGQQQESGQQGFYQPQHHQQQSQPSFAPSFGDNEFDDEVPF